MFKDNNIHGALINKDQNLESLALKPAEKELVRLGKLEVPILSQNPKISRLEISGLYK